MGMRKEKWTWRWTPPRCPLGKASEVEALLGGWQKKDWLLCTQCLQLLYWILVLSLVLWTCGVVVFLFFFFSSLCFSWCVVLLFFLLWFGENIWNRLWQVEHILCCLKLRKKNRIQWIYRARQMPHCDGCEAYFENWTIQENDSGKVFKCQFEHSGHYPFW